MVTVLQGFNAKYSKLHSRIVRTKRARPYTINKNPVIDTIPAMIGEDDDKGDDDHDDHKGDRQLCGDFGSS